MSAPAKIHELVERFDRHRDAYRAGGYNETQLRREFVDPFFNELGWDVANEHGWAEAYKDVVHEDKLQIGGATKAPDYSFRVGGVRKFFVESKKPSVDIERDAGPAYQLRRYAWSAKLALSIVTDFEEFAVYDTRVRPAKGDKASTARTIYLRCDEYVDRWDEIAEIFSKESILEGSFDRYAQSKKKRGTADVDDAFLAEIERWRELLARNIDSERARLLKGVEIGQYTQHEDLSQGEREWFKETSFLEAHRQRPQASEERIATQRITGVDENLRIVATVIEPVTYFAGSTNSITGSPEADHDPAYLLGLLNSRLFQWRFKLTSTNNNVGTNELKSMPFRTINFSDTDDIARHERMVELVDLMLTLHERQNEARTGHDKARLERRITATDNEIDHLVYELYDLTDDEVAVVEQSNGS